jgi:hypothetical protein
VDTLKRGWLVINVVNSCMVLPCIIFIVAEDVNLSGLP